MEGGGGNASGQGAVSKSSTSILMKMASRACLRLFKQRTAVSYLNSDTDQFSGSWLVLKGKCLRVGRQIVQRIESSRAQLLLHRPHQHGNERAVFKINSQISEFYRILIDIPIHDV